MALFLLATHLSAANLSGTWLIGFARDERGPIESSTCEIKQDGRSLRHCGSDRVLLMGAVGEKGLTFEVRQGDVAATFRVEATADSMTMRGTWQQPDRRGKFSARRH